MRRPSSSVVAPPFRQFLQFRFAAVALPKLDEKKTKKLSTDDDLNQVLGLYKSDYRTALRVVLV